MKNLHTRKTSNGSNFGWLIRQMSINQKSGRQPFHRRFVSGSVFCFLMLTQWNFGILRSHDQGDVAKSQRQANFSSWKRAYHQLKLKGKQRHEGILEMEISKAASLTNQKPAYHFLSYILAWQIFKVFLCTIVCIFYRRICMCTSCVICMQYCILWRRPCSKKPKISQAGQLPFIQTQQKNIKK